MNGTLAIFWSSVGVCYGSMNNSQLSYGLGTPGLGRMHGDTGLHVQMLPVRPGPQLALLP